MNWQKYIHSSPDIVGGKPVIKGTGLSVEFILGRLANGWTEQKILKNYPDVKVESMRAVFAYLLDSSPTNKYQASEKHEDSGDIHQSCPEVYPFKPSMLAVDNVVYFLNQKLQCNVSYEEDTYLIKNETLDIMAWGEKRNMLLLSLFIRYTKTTPENRKSSCLMKPNC